jgi:RNA polymerase sigma-70 factor, ECF subfamily
MPPLDDIIRRAQQGNRDAVGRLYDLFSERIYRYVAYRTANTGDAEDLTAEVFVRMVEGLPSYRRTGAPFEAWLYRIAAARVADYHRREKRRQQVELSEGLVDEATLPEEQLQEQQEVERLRRALRQLGDEHQTILILRFVERKSHEEVALILNKSVSAVKSGQHRALLQLVKAVGSEAKLRHYLRGTS